MDMIAILVDRIEEMATGLIRALPQFAIALVVLIVTWLAAKLARRLAAKAMARTQIRPGLATLVKTLVTVLVWIVGILLALAVLLPGVTAASLLAVLGLGSVAIGFAFKDIFENFLAGVLIMLRRQMRIGDVIECEGITGKVEHITLRETHVRKLSNEVTIVPNAMLFKNPVEIFTEDPGRRHEVVCGVAYDADLDRAAEVIEQAVESCAKVDGEKKIAVLASEFGDSSINFLIRWWSGSTPRDGHESRDEVVRAVKRALDEAGIEIPFPYVTHTFKEPLRVERGGKRE